MLQKLRIRHSHRLVLAIAAVVAALAIAGVALAVQVTVDDFTSGFENASITIPASPAFPITACDPDLAGAASALGQRRKLNLQVLSGTQARTAQLIADSTPGVQDLSFSTGVGVEAIGTAIWDGTNSGNCSINNNGLGGVDLTDAGSNTGFLLSVTSDDRPMTTTIQVYSAAGMSQFSVILPGNINLGEHVDYFLPFSSFTGSASFASAGAVALVFDDRGVTSAGADATITLLRANTTLNDFGDLPDTYITSLPNGPRHLPSTGLRLGNSVDAETNASSPSINANGDDSNATPNDEEGVGRVKTDIWTPSATVNLTVTVNGCTAGNCRLNGWLDWGNDGSFAQAGDLVLSDRAISNGANQNIPIIISGSYITGTSISARFRLCSATGQCNTVSGLAPNGEVEDYRWGFTPTAVTLGSLQAQPVTSPVVPVALVGVSAAVLIGVGLFIRRRKTA